MELLERQSKISNQNIQTANVCLLFAILHQFQPPSLEVQSGSTYLQSLAVKLIRDAFDHLGFLLTISTTSV